MEEEVGEVLGGLVDATEAEVDPEAAAARAALIAERGAAAVKEVCTAYIKCAEADSSSSQA